MPTRHNVFKKRTKTWPRGYSMSLHCEDITLTYWSDANSVVFMDNDVPNILEWDTIERRCRGGEIQVVRVPLVGSIYQKVHILS